MSFEYLLILIIIFVSTLFLEKTHLIHLYHTRKERFEIVALFFAIGVIWDTFAIWRGHWHFPEGGTLGVKIGLMPIEEYLFILIIPYFIITLYKILDSKFNKKI